MSNKNIDLFKTRIKWKVYNQELKQIDNYSYSCFTFKFNIVEQYLQEEFIDLITVDRLLLPWEVCNFFIERGLKYSIHFRYIKEANLWVNIQLFKTVLQLKLDYLKLSINKYICFEKEYCKKTINDRERNSLLLKLFLPMNGRMYFFQADSNIWWLPKVLKSENESANMKSIGWLFSQVGVFKLKDMKGGDIVEK